MNDLKSFEEHLDAYHGKKGTESRVKFDSASMAFQFGVLLKEARLEANLSQDQLAEKAGTTRASISAIENGESDLTLSELNNLIELGLQKSVSISII